MPEMGHLNANLMMTAGFEVNFHQTVRSRRRDHPIVESCLLAGAGWGRENTARAVGLPFEMVLQEPGGFFRNSDDDREIAFPDGSRPELVADATGGFGGAAEQHHPRYRPVQTMHQPEKSFPLLVAAFFQPGFRQLQKGGSTRTITLNEQPGGFIKGQEMVVLIA